MPQIKQIIFLKDKSGEFKLRDDIRSFGFDDRRGQFYVQFKKGDNYLFYNPSNVEMWMWLSSPDNLSHRSA